MQTRRFKVTGPVAIRGFLPGQEFTLKTDDKGAPIDAYWRARLKEEEEYGLNHLKEVKAEAPSKDAAKDEDAPSKPEKTGGAVSRGKGAWK